MHKHNSQTGKTLSYTLEQLAALPSSPHPYPATQNTGFPASALHSNTVAQSVAYSTLEY